MMHQAIYKLYPSVFTIRGEDAYDVHGNIVEYDRNAVQDYVDSRAYISKRAAEYPSIGDQLDALWKGGEAATEMLAKVQAVKTKYPKSE